MTARLSAILLTAAQTWWGRVLMAALAAAALLPGFGNVALSFAGAIALCSFRPDQRRSVVSLLALLVCVYNIGPKGLDMAANRVPLRVLIVAAVWIACLMVWTRFPSSVKHPMLMLHVGAAAFLAGAWAMRAGGRMSAITAGALCSLVPELLWRSSYWIKWRLKQNGPAPIWQNLFAALPFVGSGGVPYGKGPGYFAKHEAMGRVPVAAAQLEGMKLLLLATIWRLVDGALGVVSGSPPSWIANAPFADWAFLRDTIPAMTALLQTPDLFSLWQRWAGLYLELFHNILTLATYGHTLIGALCLLGFRIPRNTDAPLLATTILDFWNRYYFYFNELLVDFFFFPAFLKTSGASLAGRTLAATAWAAFAGNMYYHLVLYWSGFVAGNAAGFEALISSRLIYCVLLTVGLCASFMRSPALGMRQPRTVSRGRRVLQSIGVSLFFALLHVWNYSEPVGVTERWEFCKSLLVWN
jgi:hypothetical protein